MIIYIYTHAGIFSYVAQSKADTFFCFSLLMSDMRDAFVKTMDNEEGGMMGRIDKFSALLKEKDEEVA